MHIDTTEKATEKQLKYLADILTTLKNTRDKNEKRFLEKLEEIIDINNLDKKNASEWISCFKDGNFKIQLKNEVFEAYYTDLGYKTLEDLKDKHTYRQDCHDIGYCYELLERDLEENGGDTDGAADFFKHHPDSNEFSITLIGAGTVIFSKTYFRI